MATKAVACGSLMQSYIIRRIVLIFPTLLILSVITFGLVNLMPGDVVTNQLFDNPSFRPEDMDKLRHQLGIDSPVYEQYGRWMRGVLHGDLGHSLWSSKSVRAEIGKDWPVTFELGLLAFIMSATVATLFGVFSAIRQDSLLDYSLRFVSVAGLSVPSFWIGTLFIALSSRWFGYLPPLQYVPFMDNPGDNLRQFLPPAVIIATASSAGLMRVVRSAMLDVLRQDYIRTAWAKGLRERSVIARHAIKNAMIPVVTVAGAQFVALISGAVLLESIFNLPGLGRLLLNSVLQRDFIMIQGVVLVIGMAYIFVNLVVDISYAWLDPRVKY